MVRATLAVALLTLGCHSGNGGAPASKEAPVPVVAPAPAEPAETAHGTQTHPAMTGGVRDGDDAEEEGGPSPLKLGNARWKDTAVYVDGVPVGVLSFGELPIGLQPTWVDDEKSIPVKPGQKGPHFKIEKQRHYRFTDYLVAAGVDLAKVKELHVYGPKYSETIIVGGDELRKRGKDFYFRFGGEVTGKAIPRVPDDFGNGKTPDKISAVMVYIDKVPPKLIRNRGLELDGKIITDVPYYGEPIRGGVRVYKDDRLATIIKRKLLQDGELAEVGADGVWRWKLFAFLHAQGVDTSKIAEGWVIRNDRRQVKLSRAELEKITFVASPAAKGEILLGDSQIQCASLALHSKPLRADQLPKILPEEDNGPAAETAGDR